VTGVQTCALPISATPVEESFKSATAARTHAKEHFGAEAGQFATR